MIKSYFPTLIYQAPLEKKLSLSKQLLKECEIYRDLDEDGQKWSTKNYLGGYTSYASINNLHHLSPTFAVLEKKLERHLKRFTKKLEMDLGGGRLQMSTCWINIMPAKTSHSLHLHPLSVLSGTYYLATPPGSSALKFEDPRLSKFMAAPPKTESAQAINQRFINVQPKAGELILFESWLRHEVPANLSQKPRVSISFNYEWV
jgi:uncharacterized protein (TIGR02466 family)